jgi:hypothetical protein
MFCGVWAVFAVLTACHCKASDLSTVVLVADGYLLNVRVAVPLF